MKNYCLLFVVIVLFLVPVTASAAITYGDQITGVYRNFYTANPEQSTLCGSYALTWDPTHTDINGNYDRLYALDTSTSSPLYRGGLYAIDVYNSAQAVRVARDGVGSANMATIDSSGNVYTGTGGTPSVWKVANPMGESTETQMLGNYGGVDDDDPSSIGMVPVGFGVGTAGTDLILFDGGMDTNYNAGVVVLYSDSTEADPHYSVVWNDTLTSGIRGAVSNYDGYAYFTTYTLGSENNKYYINRVKGNGALQRVFLNIDPEMMIAATIDYAITVNEADGSVWLAIKDNATGDRVVYRIDAGNASYLGDGDYLAGISAQLSLTGDDAWSIGNQNLAISPDGKFLAVNQNGGQDQVHIYNLVPEPATMLLLASGMLILSRRSKQ